MSVMSGYARRQATTVCLLAILEENLGSCRIAKGYSGPEVADVHDPEADLDMARKFRTIEWLKSELVAGVGSVFRAILKNSEDAILEALAGLVITIAILGRRMGIPFSRLDAKIESKVRANIQQQHEVERWYGDFSALLHHIQAGKR